MYLLYNCILFDEYINDVFWLLMGNSISFRILDENTDIPKIDDVLD